ncbi:MAG: hypothetical protein KAU14_06155 [Thermoplasmata archaeon]|nr:hypothetical protein [Thermoplasmata archaeon]
MTIEEDIKKQLEKLPDSTILYLNSDTKNYYRAMLATVDFLVNKLKYGGVYISSTRPVSDIRIQMEASGIPTGDIHFVDSVIYLIGGESREERTAYVESPSMLETIMLKLDWQLKQVGTPEKFVFFDSMNGLAVYNEEKLLMEFIHVFSNNMRMQDLYTVLISVREQTPANVDSLLRLNCDDIIEVGASQGKVEEEAVIGGGAKLERGGT